MIEELKLIVELFQSATDKALYAFLAYGMFNLLKQAMIVFPIVHAIKFFISRAFVGGNNETKKD